jgi:LacI family transcriptional regulator
VLAAMKRLGYVYNRAAANLRSPSTRMVGLVVPDITNPYFSELAVSTERVLDEKGYSVYLANSGEDRTKQRRLLDHLAEYNVEGVLLCPARGTTRDDLASPARRSLTCILVARYLDDVKLDYVGADNRLGARLATEHLVGCGHRRIAFIGGPTASSARRDRIAGYRTALKTAGVPYRDELAVYSEVTREGGRQAIRELLALRSAPTAAVCYNDVVAIGVMHGLAEVGVRPGAAFGVVGFDDVADAALWVPGLSTVASPSREIAETAAELLLRRVAAPRSARRFVTLPASLIVRESSRPGAEGAGRVR